jgi:hypothetical protein
LQLKLNRAPRTACQSIRLALQTLLLLARGRAIPYSELLSSPMGLCNTCRLRTTAPPADSIAPWRCARRRGGSRVQLAPEIPLSLSFGRTGGVSAPRAARKGRQTVAPSPLRGGADFRTGSQQRAYLPSAANSPPRRIHSFFLPWFVVRVFSLRRHYPVQVLVLPVRVLSRPALGE